VKIGDGLAVNAEVAMIVDDEHELAERGVFTYEFADQPLQVDACGGAVA
jgi:hypothetical protein